jgi:rubrerythrin
MADFTNPFTDVVPDKQLTFNELIRAIRLDIAAEEDAISLYTAHSDATDDETVKKVLNSIASEEQVHVGEFQELLNQLLDSEKPALAKGAEEVDNLLQKV